MTLPVFFGEHRVLAQSDPSFSQLQEGDSFTWSGSEVHHALSVQRHSVASQIELIDGNGKRIRADITSIHDQSKSQASAQMKAISVEMQLLYQPSIILVQALAKGRRDEQAVESAIEIGIDEIIPWAASRCQVQWKGAKAVKGKAKWDNLADAATKQSRRSYRPLVHDLMDTQQLSIAIEECVRSGDQVFVLYEEATVPFSSIVMNMSTAPSNPDDDKGAQRKIWMVVGPEGGISDDEIRTFTAVGANPVRLGREIMRSSTAGPAAIAVLVNALGRWKQGKEAMKVRTNIKTYGTVQ